MVAERVRIEKEPPGSVDHAVLLKHLTKTYGQGPCGRGGPKRAVRGVTLGIPRQECLGFLG